MCQCALQEGAQPVRQQGCGQLAGARVGQPQSWRALVGSIELPAEVATVKTTKPSGRDCYGPP